MQQIMIPFLVIVPWIVVISILTITVFQKRKID